MGNCVSTPPSPTKKPQYSQNQRSYFPSPNATGREQSGTPPANGGQPPQNEQEALRKTLLQQHGGVTRVLEDLIITIKNTTGDATAVTKIKQLGQGGFGQVWLALDAQGQQIALKEFNEPFIYDPSSKKSQAELKRLPFAEAAIQTLFASKNIVRTHSAHVSIVDPDTHEPLGIKFTDVVGKQADQWTSISHIIDQDPSTLPLPPRVGLNMRIVMEFCEYGSLWDYLRSQHSKSDKRVVPMHIALANSMEQTLCAEMTALDIARGLRLLHKSGVIHGDLKPHNILLAKDSEDPRGFVAKVSDFGLSGHVAKGADAIRGIMYGSPPYMAPESLRDRAITYRSDVYAFGVIMWEIWHNEQWFSIFEMHRRMHKLSNTEMKEFVPRCHSSCPREYADIVEQCLSLDPLQRPRPLDIARQLEDLITERQTQQTQ